MTTRGAADWSSGARVTWLGLAADDMVRSVTQRTAAPTEWRTAITCSCGTIRSPATRSGNVRTSLRQRPAGSVGRRPHPAGSVQDGQVPGPALRLGAAHGPGDLGLPRLGRGRCAVHPDLGPVQGAA